MTLPPATRDRIQGRLRELGAIVSDEELSSLARYYDVLRKWNARINLTALADDEAGVDRLIAEPVLAARVMPERAEHLDVGSGGGSPAFPVRVLRPAFRSVLVESRLKKAAFLREVARAIPVDNVKVESCRMEDLVQQGEAFSLVTIRAVRIDAVLLSVLETMLSPGAVLWYFTGPAQASVLERAGWTLCAEHVLLAEKQSRALCFTWNSPSDVPRGTLERVVTPGDDLIR